MTTRVYIDGSEPRIITSKLGHDANPDLDDVNKTFDSRWYSGGGIRWTLWGARPSLGGGRLLRVNFPQALNHVPRVEAFTTIKFKNRMSYFNANPVGLAWPSALPDYNGFVKASQYAQVHTVDNTGVTLSFFNTTPILTDDDVYYSVIVYGV